MGQDKRLLAVGGTPLLARCLAVMTSVLSEVLLVTAPDSDPVETSGWPVYTDIIPNCASLGGLYTGLIRAQTQRIFAVACDMPFLDSRMIRWFVDRDPAADVVMARLASGPQPLHAVYGKGALPYLERMAQCGQLRIQEILSEPALKSTVVGAPEFADIDPECRSFRNVNTPEDLEAARAEAVRQP